MTKTRLRQRYDEELMPQLEKQYEIRNRLAVPRLRKIVVNMGIGNPQDNAKRIEAAQKELAQITGQAPALRRARKSISNFKLRAGMPIGLKVTLRGDRMYEFLDRLISVVIPRIRDFRGFPDTSFDGRGNYTLGLAEQIVFPEINIDKVEFVQGMDVCMNIGNSTDEMSLTLLQGFGFPFRRR